MVYCSVLLTFYITQLWIKTFQKYYIFPKWVFPEAGGPYIRILFGLIPLKELNSLTTLSIFLTKPSLQCQSNLNLGGASGFSSSCCYSSSKKASNTFVGLSLKSNVNISKLSFSIAPSARETYLYFPAPNPLEIDSISFFWDGLGLWSIANI